MLNDKLVKWFLRSVPANGTNVTAGIPISISSDIGLVRKENQDRVSAMRVNSISSNSGPAFLVVALVDGMGGMRDGNQCAAITLSSFFNSLIRHRNLSPGLRMEFAANEANSNVHDFAKGRGGATLSAILLTGGDVFTLNVGDSRIYARLSRSEKKIARLTVDDSLKEAVGGTGTELLQYIGMGEGLSAHLNIAPKFTNRILLTSDGIHFIGDECINDVLMHAASTAEVAMQLRTIARWRGAPDNASLAVVDLEDFGSDFLKSPDVGVELWDPYSALHIMWIRPPEVIDEGLYKINDNESMKIDENKAFDVIKKNFPKSTVVRKPRAPRKKTTKPDSNQLSIEIGIVENIEKRMEGGDDSSK
ncbi:PP2C family protein-serine/threonine phosphatase [Janthinobacterium sp. LB3P118]|uniref:PP2C family protein-serine/threonine phosphatase n=1 Tax=Janthinobacterium sp. LB3P118 TaxID=3424195 RepID=UPI003F233BBE